MRRAVLIVNPAAGGGRTAKSWRAAQRALIDAGFDTQAQLTDAPGHATTLAEDAARSGADVVVAMGGDGTAFEVANGLLRTSSPPPLGLIQTGTGRDLSRVLRLPRGIEAQARLVAEAEPLSFDVGWCEYEAASGRQRAAFLLLGGAGFSAQVVERSVRWKRYTRSLTYFLAALAEWWSASAVSAQTTIDGASEQLRVLDVQLLNAPWVGGGMHLAPGADPQDGRLEALITLEQNRWRLLNLLLRLYSGKHIGRRGVRYLKVERLRVEPTPALTVALDGETVGHTPAEFWIAPGALSVMAKEVRLR